MMTQHAAFANIPPIVIRISFQPDQAYPAIDQHQLSYQTSSALPQIALKDIWECFSKQMANRIKARTLESYQCSFLQFQNTTSILTIDQVTADSVERFMAERSTRVRSSTVNKDRRHLRSIWNVAIRKGLTENNPFSEVRPLKEPSRKVTVLSQDDLDKLLQAVDTGKYKSREEELRIKATILIAVQAGLRSNEIRHIRWSDIDLQTGRIDIACRESWTTKNGKDRISYILQDTLDILKQLKAERKWHAEDMPLAFASHRYAIGTAFKKVAQRADVSCTLHDLRRTCATWMAEAGENTLVITSVMGHGSPLTTQKYYTNVSVNALQQAVSRAHKRRSHTVSDNTIKPVSQNGIEAQSFRHQKR